MVKWWGNGRVNSNCVTDQGGIGSGREGKEGKDGVRWGSLLPLEPREEAWHTYMYALVTIPTCTIRVDRIVRTLKTSSLFDVGRFSYAIACRCYRYHATFALYCIECVTARLYEKSQRLNKRAGRGPFGVSELFCPRRATILSQDTCAFTLLLNPIVIYSTRIMLHSNLLKFARCSA